MTLPTFSLFGTPEPLAIPALIFSSADAGGLSRSIREAHHLEGATDHARLANNYALARAIQAGLKTS